MDRKNQQIKRLQEEASEAQREMRMSAQNNSMSKQDGGHSNLKRQTAIVNSIEYHDSVSSIPHDVFYDEVSSKNPGMSPRRKS